MDDMIRSTVIPKENRGAGTKSGKVEPTLFKLKAPLLDQGRGNYPMAHTEIGRASCRERV